MRDELIKDMNNSVDNPLKTVEELLEGNTNMIDGIINNLPLSQDDSKYGLDDPLYSEEQRKLLQEKLKEAIGDYKELAESADDSVPLPLYLERTYEQCFMEFFNLKEEIDRNFPYQKSLMEEMANIIDLNKFTPNQLEELEKAFAEGKTKLLSEHRQISEGWQIPFESVKNYFKSFEDTKNRIEIANLNKNGFTIEGILHMHQSSVKQKSQIQDNEEMERRR